MFGTQDLALFVMAGIILNLTPGPDTLYIVGKSISEGRKAGVMSVLGISSGIIIHTFLAAFGLSAVLLSSAALFNLIKWAGALYLITIGIRAVLKKKVVEDTAVINKISARSVYRQGLITNVLNPKVALFFLAFLPQFVSPDAQGVVPFLFLGAIFVFTGTLWCLLVAFFSASVSGMLNQNKKIDLLINKLTGVVFIGLGLRIALQEK